MSKGFLPIGSVVLLKNSKKKVMIIGVCQRQLKVDEIKIWDYVGCVYPEGYMSADQSLLFNNDQIERIFALGYQDEEQFEFSQKIVKIIEEKFGNNEEEKKEE